MTEQTSKSACFYVGFNGDFRGVCRLVLVTVEFPCVPDPDPDDPDPDPPIEDPEEKDPELAEEIRNLMFVFEDIVHVDDQGIQNLIKELESSQLAIALKTAPEEVKAKIFSNMSTRAAKLLNEDLDSLGPTRLSDVESTQSQIVLKVKDLEAKGKAIISRGGEGGETFV